MEIKRDKYLQMLQIRRNNGFVKVITGIRRCGKSYLMNDIFYNALIAEGVDESHIVKFAFDSADDLLLIGENLQDLVKNKKKVDPQKFMAYVFKRVTDENMYYLLLDEVQNLDYFEAVLNRYLCKKNMDVYVTGNNSKFLSSDVLTEFVGRGGMDKLVFNTFFEALGNGRSMPIDVYDMATWMSISVLSKQSLSMGLPVAFPDFTDGKWVSRKKDFEI